MAVLTNYRLRGMDLRSSKANSRDDHASYVLNMVQNSSGEWVKRNGSDTEVTIANAIDDQECKKAGKHIFLLPDKLVEKVSATTRIVNFGGDAPAYNWSVPASWAEYNGVLYFTDPSGLIDLFKYDGYMMYRAGLPQVSFSAAPGAGANYYRYAFSFIDLQGNSFYGDYVQVQAAAVGGTINTLYGTSFYNKYGQVNGIQTISSVDLTLTVNGHNYSDGDFIRAKDSNGLFHALEISDASDPNILVFTAASVGAYSFPYSNLEPVERRVFLTVFESTASPAYGFNEVANYVVDSRAATQAVGSMFAHDRIILPMEDIYDTTIVKGLPPRYKYITIYNNVMVLANDSQAAADYYSNPEDSNYRNEDTIAWSDLSVGSSVEVFGPEDREVIGKTNEGGITALHSDSDSIIILKQLQVYYLNGILTGRLFRTRSAKTSKIGCVSHKSVHEFDGGCLFMSSRGVYLARNGQIPTEFTDLIEPLFTEDTTGLDLTASRTILNEKNEMIFIYIPATLPSNSIILGYSYYWKDWFIHKSLICDSGFSIIDNVIYYTDSSGKVKKSISDKNDDGVKIDAYWASSWITRGSATLRKKFVRLILLSIGVIEWTANIVTQYNWDDSTDDTDQYKDFSSTVHVDDQPLNIGKHLSLRVLIKNSVVNEDMLVTGYELEYEQVQKKAKGES